MFCFFRRKTAKKATSLEADNENQIAFDTQNETAIQDHYIADQPITGKAEDRFNRASFATRIAETIATRVDPSSIVLGIYGPWGDGKTSVLEMMQEALGSYPNAIVIRFNPWHFQSEDLLLRGFFATLADAMGQSLPNMKEKAGALLTKYGSVLSLASLTVGGVVQVNPGDATKGVGEAMSNVGLDELRKRIEQMLNEANSVPVGDVPDAAVAALCEMAPAASDAERRAALELFAARQGLPRVISRLRQREESLTQAQATALISTFAMNGDFLPRERGMMVLADTRAKAGMLIAGLLRQVPAGELRQAEAQRAIQIAMPVGFAMECIRWIRNYEDTPPERRVLTDEGEASLRAILATRIEEADAVSPLFIAHPKDAPSLYWSWANGTSVTHVRQRLEALFDAAPEQMDAFLGCYTGESWGMESGLPRPADFAREQYNSVSHLIPAEYVAANLRLRYGAELDTPQNYPPDIMAQPRRVAHQFMTVHQAVLHTQSAATQSVAEEEPDINAD